MSENVNVIEETSNVELPPPVVEFNYFIVNIENDLIIGLTNSEEGFELPYKVIKLDVVFNTESESILDYIHVDGKLVKDPEAADALRKSLR
jgi:hypothetical protein